jgi:endonuclease/exonuclease/phosphatase family metal-dependent hydrolase
VPILQTGDFNADATTEAYRMLTHPSVHGGFFYDDTLSLARTVKIRSNVSPPPAYDPRTSIDHIFVNSSASLTRARWSVSEWSVDMYQYPYAGQLYPSDHFAVVASVQLISS